jgi:hypothetical protein
VTVLDGVAPAITMGDHFADRGVRVAEPSASRFNYRLSLYICSMKRLHVFFLFWLISGVALPQIVYQDLSNRNIYNFLDELANLKVIDLFSAIKPFSRELIAQKLEEANLQLTRLNKRQQNELAFYLRNFQLERSSNLDYLSKKGFFKNKTNFRLPFNPLQFVYKDSVFTFVLRPVFGIRYIQNQNGSAYHRWNGAEAFGYIGRHFGFYANLRDNHESKLLTGPQMLNQEEGAAWKIYPDGSGDYSEMRGGLTWEWNWGDITFAKDHFQWGDHYHGSNIISGRTPSVPYLQLHVNPLKWFEFTVLEAWLVSEVPDTTKTYQLSPGIYRITYFNKFFAAGMFTFKPLPGLDLSVGNSVVYCSAYMNPAYLSPLLFYFNYPYAEGSDESAFYGKEVQTFINLSSRNIRHLHLYGNIFINHPDKSGTGYKLGFRVSDWLLQNVSVTTEFTRNMANAYGSELPTTSFKSNNYLFGSYLTGNARELFVSLNWKPFRGMDLDASCVLAEHGEGTSLTTLDYRDRAIILSASYEIINNAYVSLKFQHRQVSGDAKYYPALYKGTTDGFEAGVNIGF